MEMAKKEILINIIAPFVIRADAAYPLPILTGSEQLKKEYLEALQREILAAVPDLEEYRVCGMHVGNGSPNSQNITDICALTKKIYEVLDFAPLSENSIELTPGTICESNLAAIKDGNFNRIDLIVRSRDDIELEKLGCPNSWPETQQAMKILSDTGFEHVNCILNYALPDQGILSFQRTVEAACSEKPQLITIWPYPKAEPGTMLRREMYRSACTILQAAGYHQFSRDCFTSGRLINQFQRDRCSGMDVIGFGLRAESWYGGFVYNNTQNIDRYMAHSNEMEAIIGNVREVSQDETMAAYCNSRLDLAEGLLRDDFYARFGCSIPSELETRLDEMKTDGLAEESDGRITLTEEGFALLA